MNYYIVYQLEVPCFQLTRLPSTIWGARDSILYAIAEHRNPGSISFKPFETIDERISHITTDTRHFSYYGPFDSIDDLSSYFTNNHPELLI